MESYGNTTDKSSNQWKASIVFLLLLVSLAKSQQLIIEQSPKNATVSLGESVTLTCVFSQPVDCNWMKDDQPYRIKSGDGNIYTGDRLETRDCSIKIYTVTENDFAKWHCASFASKGIPAVSSEGIWVTKRDEKADHRTPIIIAGVLGAVLIVTIVAVTATLLRRKRRCKNKVSPTPLPTIAQLNASAMMNRGGQVAGPVSEAPTAPHTTATHPSTALYENVDVVRHREVDSHGYLLPLHHYEEIKDHIPKVKGDDDSGYMTLK